MADYPAVNYQEQGGARRVVGSGGSLDVESGGEIDVESGGALKLAGTAVTATAAELNMLDTSAPVDGLRPLGLIRATYDFTVNGGAISTISLDAIVPDNAIIYDGIIEVITTCTSATDAATIAVQALAANDIVSVLAISNGGNIWDAGYHAVIPDKETTSDYVKMTSALAIKVVIAVEAVTAGKFVVLLRYMDGG